MTTMVEKMARAMILAVSPDRDFAMNPYYEVERNYWDHIARAALTALLEPSEGMVEVAIPENAHAVTRVSLYAARKEGFRAMIQAALDEREG